MFIANIGRNINRVAVADIKFIGDDAGRKQPAAANCHNFIISTGIFNFFANRFYILVKFFPANIDFISH